MGTHPRPPCARAVLSTPVLSCGRSAQTCAPHWHPHRKPPHINLKSLAIGAARRVVRPLRTKKRFGTNDRNVPFGAPAGKAATHQAAVGTRHVTRVPRARLRVCASACLRVWRTGGHAHDARATRHSAVRDQSRECDQRCVADSPAPRPSRAPRIVLTRVHRTPHTACEHHHQDFENARRPESSCSCLTPLSVCSTSTSVAGLRASHRTNSVFAGVGSLADGEFRAVEYGHDGITVWSDKNGVMCFLHFAHGPLAMCDPGPRLWQA